MSNVFPVWRVSFGPLVSVCWQSSWHLTRATRRPVAMYGAMRGKQTSLPANTTNIQSCLRRDKVWPLNTRLAAKYFPLLLCIKGNYQWFIRNCIVFTITTVHIRILLILAVLESNFKAIFSYKGGFHVTRFWVTVHQNTKDLLKHLKRDICFNINHHIYNENL